MNSQGEQKKRVLIIHGPNMNLLGEREPEKYGTKSLDDVNSEIRSLAEKMNMEVDFYQSNHEGDIIDAIQKAGFSFDAVVINPAGYTHTSVAIKDAISAVPVPVIEVHMTNIFSREDFRSSSVTAPACRGVIAGFGEDSYKLGLWAAALQMAGRESQDIIIVV